MEISGRVMRVMIRRVPIIDWNNVLPHGSPFAS